MKAKKEVKGPKAWSVGDLGVFYTEHSFELKAHANRILKDPSRADEIVQDAFIKVLLAAPELESPEHALGYLHRTIENLCIDLFRAEGRRPNLVVLDDARAEIESNWHASGDHSQVITAAEDAAIIRQALALLSPAERTALVMWEMDGRSTTEIAKELGIKESSVRHTVSRARASLRNVLATLIVDKERGTTALEALSMTYKKAAELAHKTSRSALSLILVVAAFLGFHTITGNNVSSSMVSIPTPSSTVSDQQVVHPITHPIKSTSPSRAEQIAALEQQLGFAQVQLGAQVDLLTVINDLDVFHQNSVPSVQVAALSAIPSQGITGGN